MKAAILSLVVIASLVLLAPTMAQTTASENLPRERVTYTPTGLVQTRTKSFVDMRFEGIERQRHDLSCGAAALATLLRHYYDAPIGERDIIERIFGAADEKSLRKIANAGFSLLELKQTAERAGFAAGGFRLADSSKLYDLKVPVITIITTRGYSHFVVVKRAAGDKVYIADPAFGNRTVKMAEFAQGWGNIVLVVLQKNGVLGNADFIIDQKLALTQERMQSIYALNTAIVPKGVDEF
jgi:Predicted double-glycine peptidase